MTSSLIDPAYDTPAHRDLRWRASLVIIIAFVSGVAFVITSLFANDGNLCATSIAGGVMLATFLLAAFFGFHIVAGYEIRRKASA